MEALAQTRERLASLDREVRRMRASAKAAEALCDRAAVALWASPNLSRLERFRVRRDFCLAGPHGTSCHTPGDVVTLDRFGDPLAARAMTARGYVAPGDYDLPLAVRNWSRRDLV